MNCKLIIVAAPSGTGKSTLCSRLIHEFSEKIKLSISTTSRLPRGSEKDGIEYYFLTEDQFKSKIANGEFAEWANVHGNYYGTLKSTIDNFFNQGQSVLLDIDVQGAASLREAYPGQCVSVFLEPPSMEALEKRLRDRGTESEESIVKRLKNSKEEMDRKHEFDVVLVNDDLEQAYKKFKKVVLEKVFNSGLST